MQRATENRIILITRKTRLEELIVRFNTLAQAKFYVEHLGADFADYAEEDRVYQLSRTACEALLAGFGRLSVVERDYLPSFLFREKDTVVVMGQDGTVANTLKYLNGQPCIGVNPDPARWDGILVPFLIEDLEEVVPALFANRMRLKNVTFGRVDLNTGESMLAVNDFFIGASSHISARYRIEFGGAKEQHSSSGIIVSTGLGSTGWFKSLVRGALGLASQWGGRADAAAGPQEMPWEQQNLLFTVREPFPSRNSETNLLFGVIAPRKPRVIVSEMARQGVIFSDGIEKDFLAFNNGTMATISVLPDRGILVAAG
jgi:NAD kinase